jgi:hypothetical protein
MTHQPLASWCEKPRSGDPGAAEDAFLGCEPSIGRGELTGEAG